MPRHVQKSSEKLTEWCKEHQITKSSHRVYSTENGEVIVEPIRSTRPLRYAYLKLQQAKLARETAQTIAETFGLTNTELKAYEWDLEKNPGVKVRIE